MIDKLNILYELKEKITELDSTCLEIEMLTLDTFEYNWEDNIQEIKELVWKMRNILS